MTLEIWRKNSKNFWPTEPELIISAPSAAIVMMAANSFLCFTTSRYIWKVKWLQESICDIVIQSLHREWLISFSHLVKLRRIDYRSKSRGYEGIKANMMWIHPIISFGNQLEINFSDWSSILRLPIHRIKWILISRDNSMKCQCDRPADSHQPHECYNRAVYIADRNGRAILLCAECNLNGTDYNVRKLNSDDSISDTAQIEFHFEFPKE